MTHSSKMIEKSHSAASVALGQSDTMGQNMTKLRPLLPPVQLKPLGISRLTQRRSAPECFLFVLGAISRSRDTIPANPNRSVPAKSVRRRARRAVVVDSASARSSFSVQTSAFPTDTQQKRSRATTFIQFALSITSQSFTSVSIPPPQLASSSRKPPKSRPTLQPYEKCFFFVVPPSLCFPFYSLRF
jgi:hypothetical protein